MKKIIFFLLLIFLSYSVKANGVFDFDLVLSNARTNGSVNLILDNGRTVNITKQHAENINQVRQRISSNAGIYPKFFISSDMKLNAYAQGAGGQGVVTITYGLLQRIGTDYDALAAVIGHEFAHLNLDHSGSQTTVNTIVDILATVALAAIDASWGGSQYNQYRDLHKIGLDVGGSLAKAAYSRDDEYDADAKGVEYMLKAGYSIDGAYRMHNNIIAANAWWFDTHPSSSNRVEYIQKIAAKNAHLVERNRRSKQTEIKTAKYDPPPNSSSKGGYDPSEDYRSNNNSSSGGGYDPNEKYSYEENTTGGGGYEPSHNDCGWKAGSKTYTCWDSSKTTANDIVNRSSNISKQTNDSWSGGGYDPEDNPTNHNNDSLGLYKDQCEELGFQPNTENFGLCVLKLHKKNKSSSEIKVANNYEQKISGTECTKADDYYTSFKIDCENLPYETGGGYDPKNEKQTDNEISQIGIVVDIKENYKYIIFSSTVQRDIPLGSKIVIDGSSKIYGEVARRYEGFYSAKVNNINFVEKGHKILNAK